MLYIDAEGNIVEVTDVRLEKAELESRLQSLLGG